MHRIDPESPGGRGQILEGGCAVRSRAVNGINSYDRHYRRRRSKRKVTAELPAPVADRGLLDRRALLTGAVQVAGLVALGNRSGDLVATEHAAESPTLDSP